MKVGDLVKHTHNRDYGIITEVTAVPCGIVSLKLCYPIVYWFSVVRRAGMGKYSNPAFLEVISESR